MSNQLTPTKQLEQQGPDPSPNPNLPSAAVAGPASRVMVLQLPKAKDQLVSNFRFDDPSDAIEISRAMSPCDCNLDVYVGKLISVVGVLLNMAEFEADDGSGEMRDKVYASIVLDDDTIVGTSGKAVMGQLAHLIGSVKPGRIDPPVVFEVRSHDMPKPKQPYYSLRRARQFGDGRKKGGSK
jgi:hypothetical protein